MSHQHIACCKLKNIGMLRQQWFLAGWASDGHFEQDFQGEFAISWSVPLSSYKTSTTRPLKRVEHSTALLLYAQTLCTSPPEGHEYVRTILYCTFAGYSSTDSIMVTSSTPKPLEITLSLMPTCHPRKVRSLSTLRRKASTVWAHGFPWVFGGIYCTVLGGCG